MIEDFDYCGDALDLNIGSDFFSDSQTMSLREEVVESEAVFADGMQDSQESLESHESSYKLSQTTVPSSQEGKPTLKIFNIFV